MEFETHHISCNETEIHLLKYDEFSPTEYLDKLTPEEIARLSSFKSASRKREFVAVRILRDYLLGLEPIHYNAVGAPYIDKEVFISISHSKNTVGFALNKEYSIGLDLEYPQEKILKIQSKFITI